MRIQPPKNCPSCSSVLVWKKDLLYCLNTDCGVKTQKALEHWTKVMKIKGLGPKTIEALEITSIVDLYNLSMEDLTEANGSEKNAEKIAKEIEKSKANSLELILAAFNIPLIGRTASEKICNVIANIDEISESKLVEAKLGPKARDSVLNWFENVYIVEYKGKLPLNFNTSKVTSNKPTQLAKGIVCISGKLTSFKTKALATAKLEEQGYVVKSSLTKDVTILINESGKESAKTKTARESGITIVTDTNTLIS